MNTIILKSFSEVEPYIPIAQQYADQNRNAFGFLSKKTYEEQACQGRLWIATDLDSKEYIGHLLFGGRFPTLKITQINVQPKFRKASIASTLLNELIKYGESLSFLEITARVAADLPSNSFWEKSAFLLIRQEKGGSARKRTINIRGRELDSPSLFKLSSQEDSEIPKTKKISYVNRPIFNIPSYVIDLNVFFDIVKKRLRHKEARALISAGFDSHIKICVTSEFKNELSRNSVPNQPDPILEFAKTFPTLPAVEEEGLKTLLNELEVIVFPEKSAIGKISERDKSDLMHLASCIHHKVSSFVTREKAILKSREDILQSYGLDIISPSDFFDSSADKTINSHEVSAFIQGQVLRIEEANENDRESIERFLLEHQLNPDSIASIWNPGTNSFPRRRICIKAGDKLIGVASWDSPSSYSKQTVLNLFIDEKDPAASQIIDHILETVSRDTELYKIRSIDLSIGKGQSYTKQSAIQRGFCQKLDEDGHASTGALTKILYRGIISSENWYGFCKEFREVTGLILPSKMPTYDEFINTGALLKSSATNQNNYIKLFEFETLLSPGILLCRKREAIILPIQVKFANELLTAFCKQSNLFPSDEVFLHVEKAYFRKPTKTNIFKRGSLLFFYVSGRGGGNKEIVGMARITYSDVLTIEEIEMNLSRQGVLSRDQLLNVSNSSGKIHVITFDNFNLIPNPVPFKTLKEKGLVSKANLVTAEKISFTQVRQLCGIAFEGTN